MAAGNFNKNSAGEIGKSIALNVTSDPANLAAVRLAFEKFAEQCGFDAKSVGDIGLCINEAMANVTRHAYSGATDRPISLSGRCSNSELRISIRDWGSGVNPLSLTTSRRDPTEPGGLGLICLRSLMDAVNYEPQADGMRLTLVKKNHRAIAV